MNEMQVETAIRAAHDAGTVVDKATARALAYLWTDNNQSGVWATRAFAHGSDTEHMPGVLREVNGLLAYIESDKADSWEDNRMELEALRAYAESVIV